MNVLWVLVQEIAYGRVKLRMEWEAVLLVQMNALHTLNIANIALSLPVPVLWPLTSVSVHLWKNVKFQRR